MTEKLTIFINNEEVTLETGKIARQANGSITLRCKDTTILTTACVSSKSSDELDFLPLRVDYQEKFSSIGKTVSGFIKREKPTNSSILTSRLIDRSLRPLFPEGFFNEIQVLSYVYSYDNMTNQDVLSICAASAALAISDIPFIKPIAAVRIGFINNEFVINPIPADQKESALDLVLAGSKDTILMIEGFCDFLTEEQILEAIDIGHDAIKKICEKISEWSEKIGKKKKNNSVPITDELKKIVSEFSKDKLINAFKTPDRHEQSEILSVIQNDLIEHVCGKDNSKFLKRDVQIAFKKMKSSYLRSLILKEKKRLDNRKLDEIRPISIETSILPRTHGSSLFTRGETQALAVCTLGGETMAQRYETLFEESSYKFYLQYFFPPFCVGEVGRSGPPGRREIGHGKLAEKSLSMILPSQEEFPYTIRLESNITESFGSSSMASICSGCLSLMDAGVPVKKVVSGIAMGLILENNEFEILSDITGTEDSLGDMDFKISGDDKGITCFQMDIKVEGITKEIMEKALFQAKQGRLHILEKMIKTCSKPKMNLSKYAPRIISMKVPVSKIGIVIGPGGKQIKSIISESGAEVDISDDGTIKILSANEDDALKAQEMIKSITAEVEKGKIYKGKIKSIKSFGLFVEICGKEGLCHISEISHSRIEDLSKIFKEGDMLEVQVLDVNDRGQIKLSHKVLLKKDS